jgi:hypothetical protein
LYRHLKKFRSLVHTTTLFYYLYIVGGPLLDRFGAVNAPLGFRYCAAGLSRRAEVERLIF